MNTLYTPVNPKAVVDIKKRLTGDGLMDIFREYLAREELPDWCKKPDGSIFLAEVVPSGIEEVITAMRKKYPSEDVVQALLSERAARFMRMIIHQLEVNPRVDTEV